MDSPHCDIEHVEHVDVDSHRHHQPPSARQTEKVNVQRVNKHHKTHSINLGSQEITSQPSTNISPLRKSVALINKPHQGAHILQRSLSNTSLSPGKLQISATQLDLRSSMHPVQLGQVAVSNVALRRSISPTTRTQLIACNNQECLSPQRSTQIVTQHTQLIPVQPVVEVPVMRPVQIQQQQKTQVVEKIIEKPVVKEVEIEKIIEKPVYYEKEIEKLVEVVKEVPGPVEYVEKVVEKPVYFENTDKIQHQEEEISELRKRLSKQPEVVEKPVYYEKEVIKEVTNPQDLEAIRELQLRNDQLRRQLDDELFHHEETRKHHRNVKPQVITKEIEKPVYIDKIIEKEVIKEVEKPVYIEQEPIVHEVVKEIPVVKEIEKIVYKDNYVEVPVEKIVEKPIYIDKIVEKEVVREDHSRIHHLEMEIERLRRQLLDEQDHHNETRKRKQKVPPPVEKTVYIENQADLKLKDEIEHWKRLCKSWKSKYDQMCEAELEYKIVATRVTRNEHSLERAITVSSEECLAIDSTLVKDNHKIISHVNNGHHHQTNNLDSHAHQIINDYGVSAHSKVDHLDQRNTVGSHYSSNGYSNGYNSHNHHH